MCGGGDDNDNEQIHPLSNIRMRVTNCTVINIGGECDSPLTVIENDDDEQYSMCSGASSSMQCKLSDDYRDMAISPSYREINERQTVKKSKKKQMYWTLNTNLGYSWLCLPVAVGCTVPNR